MKSRAVVLLACSGCEEIWYGPESLVGETCRVGDGVVRVGTASDREVWESWVAEGDALLEDM